MLIGRVPLEVAEETSSLYHFLLSLIESISDQSILGIIAHSLHGD